MRRERHGAQTGDGGANTPVRDVAAKVVFTTGLNTLLIEVTNLENNISAMNQGIAAVDFLISGVSGVVPATVTSVLQTTDTGHGSAGTFTSSTVFNPSVALGSIANPWSLATSTQILSGGLQLGAIHTAASNAKDLIIGPGPYAANGSGAGTMLNPQSNEFFQTNTNQHIAWLLTFQPGAGVDANDIVTSARLSYGLNFGANYEEILTEGPEPGTVAMMLGGFGLILAGIRRKRQRS